VDSGSTLTEAYNALGWRVEASNASGVVDYLHDAAGEMIGGSLTGGSNQYIYFRGGLMAQYWNGASFAHLNGLGSTQQFTDWTGANPVDTLFYPWGQPVNSSVESLWAGFNDGNGWLLHEWQTDTRRYTPSAGRWFTPDPLGGDVTNPQSLNRYAYVLNNPTSLTDPLGLGSEECSQSNDDNDCCNDPNYVGAECGGDGWPSGWPIWGGGGGGGGSSPTPTPTPTANNGGPGIPPGMGNAGFPGQFPWPNGGTYPCDFGLCGPIWNPYTAQVGLSGGWTFPWGVNVNFFFGLAVDLHGHVAVYHGRGFGGAVGARGSAGIQFGGSNADTVCGLGGPFMNASGTFGAEGATATADVFQGNGNGPGGIVTGGGVTVGVGGGASASMGPTWTSVVPLGSYSCP
jgi:RHS repeat-associated protein